MFSQIQQNEDSCTQSVSLFKLTKERITMPKIRPKSYTQRAYGRKDAGPEKQKVGNNVTKPTRNIEDVIRTLP